MDLTRRVFLKWLGAAVAVVALLPRMAHAKIKKVGIPLAKTPALQNVDGSVILKIKEQDVLFVRTSDAEVKAVSPVCTHQKCQVAYNAKSKQIECSCHGSKYTVDGKVLNGPAPRDLPNFKAKISGEQIVLEIEEPTA